MPYKNNSWYCSKCDFYVFNSKNACNKCSTPKPILKINEPNYNNNNNRDYLSDAERKELDNFFIKQTSVPNLSCYTCKSSDPVERFSSHNCWKRS